MQGHIWNSIICRRFSCAFRISFPFGMLLITALCLAPPMTRGQASPPPAKSAPAQDSSLTAAAASAAPRQASTAAGHSGGGPHESIQVHGHWVIEVKNPDGKVTARREFENSIQPYGTVFLASLIAANNSSGGLSVLLNGAATTYNMSFTTGHFFLDFSEAGPCLPLTVSGGIGGVSTGGPAGGTTCLITSGHLDSAGNPTGTLLGVYCLLFQGQASSTSQTAPCSTNLTETAPAFIPTGVSGSAAQLQLIGSVTVTAAVAGLVNDVETVFTTCDSNTVSFRQGCMN